MTCADEEIRIHKIVPKQCIASGLILKQANNFKHDQKRLKRNSILHPNEVCDITSMYTCTNTHLF